MIGSLQPWHVVLIVAVGFLLFGAKRLPDATRSVGQSLRIFKSEMRQGVEDAKTAAKQDDATPVESGTNRV